MNVTLKHFTKLLCSTAVAASFTLVAALPQQVIAQDQSCVGEACEEKIAKLKRLALNGSPQAQFILGTMYEFGEGVQQDIPIAMRYYSMAVSNRNAKAMYQLSAILEDGRYGEQDREKADDYLRRAADLGLPVAMVDLAKSYLVTDKDGKAETAWQLLTSAAKRNNYEARYLTALLSMDQTFPYALEEDETIEQLEFLTRRGYRDAETYLRKYVAQNPSVANERVAVAANPNAAGVERIEVSGQKISFDMALDYAIDSIEELGIYDGRSTTSRLPGRACTKWSNPPCQTGSPGVLTGTAAGEMEGIPSSGN
nr:tetratricopeptide repeat protein [Pseudidiomarina sediminum]